MHCRPERGRQDNTAEKDCGRAERTGGSPRRLHAAELRGSAGFSMTPVDFLDSTGEKSERTKIRTYLGSLKYTADEMDHPIRELSGGQKAKVLLLKMSLGNANVLILDEPTRNFSPLSGPVIRKMLREFPGAIISISHDRKYIGEVCGKEYLLEKDGLRLIREEK